MISVVKQLLYKYAKSSNIPKDIGNYTYYNKSVVDCHRGNVSSGPQQTLLNLTMVYYIKSVVIFLWHIYCHLYNHSFTNIPWLVQQNRG